MVVNGTLPASLRAVDRMGVDVMRRRYLARVLMRLAVPSHALRLLRPQDGCVRPPPERTELFIEA